MLDLEAYKKEYHDLLWEESVWKLTQEKVNRLSYLMAELINEVERLRKELSQSAKIVFLPQDDSDFYIPKD